MSKCKVGDRVIGVGSWELKSVEGIGGTVRCLIPPIGVEWDKNIGGHAGSGLFEGRQGHCWFVHEDNLRNAPVEKIVITTDGTTTLARLYDGDRVVRSAEAKCNPEDKFEFVVGANLAYDRLMGREYYSGKVVCVKYFVGFTVGKVYEFKNGVVLDDDGDRQPYRGDRPIRSLENPWPIDLFVEFKGE